MTSIMEQSKEKKLLPFILGLILVGCLLQAASFLKGDQLVFPSVLEIFKAFIRLITTGKTYLLIWTTVSHLLISMVIATIIGVGLGLLQGMNQFIRGLLKPLTIMFRSLPMIVLVVIIMVITKYERVPVIATSLVLIPIISEATCEGCLRIDKELIDVYRLHSNFNIKILFYVYIPLMAGYLRQAYINAVGMGIKLAVSTEYLVQTRNSLGKAVHSSSYFNEYQDIYAYALIMVLLVMLLSELPLWLNRRFSERKSSTPD